MYLKYYTLFMVDKEDNQNIEKFHYVYYNALF